MFRRRTRFAAVVCGVVVVLTAAFVNSHSWSNAAADQPGPQVAPNFITPNPVPPIDSTGSPTPTAPQSADSPTPTTPTTSPADYLDDAGENQCDLPAASRVGEWVCMDTTTDDALAVRAEALQDLGDADGLTSDPQFVSTESVDSPDDSGICKVTGCWTDVDSTHSEFEGDGWYGYGKTQLGWVEWFFKVTMTGASSKSTLWFRSTRGTRGVIFTGDRLALSSAHPAGVPVNGGAAYRNHIEGTVAANTTATWSGGYGSFDNVAAMATIVHEVTWNDPKYPGRWYVYGKSIKLKRNSNGGYTFQGNTLPSSPAGSGWKEV